MHDGPIIHGCRSIKEAALQDAPWADRRMGYFHTATSVLEAMENAPQALLILDTLLQDETIIGLSQKAQIIRPTYIVAALSQALTSVNVMRLYASGVYHIALAAEMEQFHQWLDPTKEVLNDMVFPPYLKLDGAQKSAKKEVHWKAPHGFVFLGEQALTAFSSAVLYAPGMQGVSQVVQAPRSHWAKIKLINELDLKEFNVSTEESAQESPMALLFNHVQDLKYWNKERRKTVIVQGALRPEELGYITKNVSFEDKVYVALSEGYALRTESGQKLPVPSTLFWHKLSSFI